MESASIFYCILYFYLTTFNCVFSVLFIIMATRQNPKEESFGISRTVDEKIELSVLLKFIKPYDGSRDKLNSFITNCQNAYSLATEGQKPILFKFIISQLEGRAEATTAIKDFETFEQLIDFLRHQFGEKKHYSHLLSELQECKQGPSESVNQFALNIETCLSKLITEINISNPSKKKTEIQGRIVAMQDLALHTFVVGLQPRLSQIVRCRDPSTLNTAISFAVAEEKILSSVVSRKPTTFINTERPKLYNQPRRELNTNNNHFNQGLRSDPNRKINTGNIVCRYCKNIGHTIENCRKRQYNNNRAQYNSQNLHQRQILPNHSSREAAGPSRVHFTNDTERTNEEETENLNF